MTRCTKDAMALLDVKALMRAKNNEVEAQVGIEKVSRTLTAILDTGASTDSLKKNCPPRTWAKHFVTMKATCLRSTADTQPAGNGVLRFEVQLGQRIAKASFLIVTNLAADMILETAYSNEIIKKICYKSSTMKPTSSSPVAIEESVDNAAYMADSPESKQHNFEDEISTSHAQQFAKGSYHLWVKFSCMWEIPLETYGWSYRTKTSLRIFRSLCSKV